MAAPLKILTLLFSVDDSSLSQDLGKSHNSSAARFTGGYYRWDDADDAYMRDDSGKLRFAGSKQRLDDDQSDCADDITRLCPEIPKGNNFALLVCLQEKAKVWFVVTVQLILNGHPLTHLKNYKFLMVPCLVQNMQNLVTNSLLLR